MIQVRLRTVINQDGSTIFQVEREDGTWVELTWDMISDKPFESLDDTVFVVDEDGVLSIIGGGGSVSWSQVTSKPFTYLSNDDFTVVNGVLTYTGTTLWSAIGGKPFSNVSSDDFKIESDTLKLKNPPTNPTWSSVSGKPFSDLDGSTFTVSGGTLFLNTNLSSPLWTAIQSKPFTYLDSNDFEVTGDTLKAKPKYPSWSQVTSKPFNDYDHAEFSVTNGILGLLSMAWSKITGKPFTYLDSDDFSVSSNGTLSVNHQTIPDPEWDDVQNKPLESLGSDFSVDSDGVASVNFPTIDWDELTGRPFETLNSSDFSVDADGELSVIHQTIPDPDWSDVQSKPFNSIGGILYTYDGTLLAGTMMFQNTDMSSGHKITTPTELRNYLQTFIINSLKKRFELDNPDGGWWGFLQDLKINHARIKILVDNTQTGLETFSDSYRISIKQTITRLWQNPTYDDYMIFVECYGLPLYSDSSKKTQICGTVILRCPKTDGNYTDVTWNGGDLTVAEAANYTFQ